MNVSVDILSSFLLCSMILDVPIILSSVPHSFPFKIISFRHCYVPYYSLRKLLLLFVCWAFFFLTCQGHLSVFEEAKQNWFHSKQICNFFCRRKCSILFWMDDMFHLDFSANSFCRSPVVFLQATWCHCGWQPSVTIVWSSYGFLGNQLSDSK